MSMLFQTHFPCSAGHTYAVMMAESPMDDVDSGFTGPVALHTYLISTEPFNTRADGHNHSFTCAVIQQAYVDRLLFASFQETNG